MFLIVKILSSRLNTPLYDVHVITMLAAVLTVNITDFNPTEAE